MVAFVCEVSTLHFGEWLKDKRLKADLTLDELALGSGRSKNYLSILERNMPHHKTGAMPNPSSMVLEDIARGLGVAPMEVKRAWAEYGNGTSAELTYDRDDESYARLQALYEGLDADDRDELIAIAELKHRKKRQDETTHGRRADN